MTDAPWRVALIGPGRAGTAVALGLQRARHRVVAVAGGSPSAQVSLGKMIAGLRAVTSPADAAQEANLIVIATPDRAIADIATELAAAGALGPDHHVIHLAGSLGLGALERVARAGARIAAVHPAQTIPRGADAASLIGAAWAVTAAPGDLGWAHDLVIDLGGDPHDVADDRRVHYHAALTVGSNAVAAATSVARQLLLAAGIDQPTRFLQGLGHRSIDNVLAGGAAAITGPIARGDVATVAAHLATLDLDAPPLADAYRHLGRAVLAQVRPSLRPGVADQLLRALADDMPSELSHDPKGT